MIITPCNTKPPATADQWNTLHWTVAPANPDALEKLLATYGLHPAEVYKDAGGTIWIPVEAEQ